MNGAAPTPVTWSRLIGELAGRIAALEPADGTGRPRVALDGADATEPGALADALAARLPALGRPAHRVRAADFLRPASLRLEYGHHDADAYYSLWLDEGALWREVFGRLESDGDGRVLPTLWDPVTDRSTRAAYVSLPPGCVLLFDGPLLLGRGFPFDLSVHLMMTPAALRRRTPQGERWTLPALERYDEEVRPGERADVVVRCDHPSRPAWTG